MKCQGRWHLQASQHTHKNTLHQVTKHKKEKKKEEKEKNIYTYISDSELFNATNVKEH